MCTLIVFFYFSSTPFLLPRLSDGTFIMTGQAELDNVCEALGLEIEDEALEVRKEGWECVTKSKEE